MLFLLQAAAKSSPSGMLSMLLPFILMFVVMYFLILRPQKRKDKDRKSLLSRIKKNDTVVTSGGIHGIIISVRENEVILRVDVAKDEDDAKNVKVKVDRTSIAAVVELSHDDTDEPKEIAKENKDAK